MLLRDEKYPEKLGSARWKLPRWFNYGFQVDLAKEAFQIQGVDEGGKAVLRKQVKRKDMAKFFASLEPCGRDGSVWERSFLGEEAGGLGEETI